MGLLVDGSSLKGVVSLRALVRYSPFMRTLTEKLLTYTLGRGMTTTICQPSADCAPAARATPAPGDCHGNRERAVSNESENE